MCTVQTVEAWRPHVECTWLWIKCPCCGHCVVILVMTPYSHSASLQPGASDGLASHPGGSINIFSLFMPQKLGLSQAWWSTWLVRQYKLIPSSRKYLRFNLECNHCVQAPTFSFPHNVIPLRTFTLPVSKGASLSFSSFSVSLTSQWIPVGNCFRGKLSCLLVIIISLFLAWLEKLVH